MSASILENTHEGNINRFPDTIANNVDSNSEINDQAAMQATIADEVVSDSVLSSDQTSTEEGYSSSSSKKLLHSIDDHDTFFYSILDRYVYLRNKNKNQRIRIIFIGLITTLIIAEGIAIIVAFLMIFKLHDKAVFLQTINLDMDNIKATTDNVDRLDVSVQALDSTIDEHYGISLDMVSKLSDQITANITVLKDNAFNLQSTTAANLTKLVMGVDIGFGSIFNMISRNLSLFNQIIANSTRDIPLTLFPVLYDILNTFEPSFSFYSCADIQKFIPSSLSGNYRITNSNGSIINAYCDMNRSCNGNTGGWMRVADIDLTNTSVNCPSSFMQSLSKGLRVCSPPSGSATCASVMFDVYGIGYSKVCGRIRGYQYGGTNAFEQLGDSNQGIDTYYVDGISLTHGLPRQHIWTFVSANSRSEPTFSNQCPCTNTSVGQSSPVPNFVDQDYFCDAGASTTPIDPTNEFYDTDPLWDGVGCGSQSTCCSFNSPPWFYKQLPQTTTDDIELRLCRDGRSEVENIYFDIVEIYVR